MVGPSTDLITYPQYENMFRSEMYTHSTSIYKFNLRSHIIQFMGLYALLNIQSNTSQSPPLPCSLLKCICLQR